MSMLSRFRTLVERFPTLAQTYRYWRDTRALSEKPHQTPLGFLFCGNPEMVAGTFEHEEVSLISRLLQDADVFIDIGANIGYYCCLALAKGKPVIAFEPIHNNLQFLYKNIHANGWDDRVEIFPLALSDRSGMIEIYGGGVIASLVKGWSDTSAGYKTFVPVSTLDATLGPRFHGQHCLVIVDIEGAEYDMLCGARQFLQISPKPVWMVEITVSKHQPQGININPNFLATFELFWQNGYEAWTINRVIRKLTEAEIRQISTGGAKTYSGHNILFVEQGRYPDLPQMVQAGESHQVSGIKV